MAFICVLIWLWLIFFVIVLCLQVLLELMECWVFRAFWEGGLVLWIRWVLFFGFILIGAKNDFCFSINVSAVPLCKWYLCGVLLLHFGVYLGIVWVGWPPPPRRFNSCVKAFGVRVASSVGMLLGWDFIFLNVYCAFVVCCIRIMLFWVIRCWSSGLVCCCVGICGVVEMWKVVVQAGWEVVDIYNEMGR